jgi:hypothetical protein
MDKTMKQIACVSALLLWAFHLSVSAQVWCPPGATWCFGFENAQSNGYQVYTYTGDTLIGGEVQQMIAVQSHYYTQDPPGYHDDTSSTPIYTRFADGVLYGFNSSLGIWDTLIWYNAAPGEEWQVFQPVDFVCDCRYTVTGTGDTLLDGISLHYVQTTITGPECAPGTRRFTERIGSVEGVFGLWECATGMDGHSLRSYQDLQLGYSPPGALPCDFISGIDEEPKQGPIRVFPNPGTDVLHVETGMIGKVDVGVHVATGRAVLTASAPGGSLEISSAGLSPGIYFIEVNTAEGRQTVKWVKR